jgi:hypothetical protein
MMKLTNIIIACSLFFLVSCVQNDGVAPSTSATGGTTASTPKATLSSWAVANSAWAMRLDINGANIDGTPFTLIVKFADNSETQCTNTVLNGNEYSGSYYTGTCTVNPVNTTMSYGTTAAAFKTTSTGTYTNNGGSITLCGGGIGCSTYY